MQLPIYHDGSAVALCLAWAHKIYHFMINLSSPTGTLDVRLMGCQDLLENVPGRSKVGSVLLPGWSPSETRSSFMSRGNRNRGASARNLSKSEDLSSESPNTNSLSY